MDKTEVLTVVSQFRSELEKKGIHVERVILFGSYARNEAHLGSDIDLVVLSKDFVNLDFWQRIELVSGVIYRLMKPIEATAMTIDEWESGESVITDFAKDGEVIFAA